MKAASPKKSKGRAACSVEKQLEQIGIREALVELRKKRGISQRELAERMGVSQPVVARIEDPDSSNVELRTLARAASALDARLEVSLVDLAQRQVR